MARDAARARELESELEELREHAAAADAAAAEAAARVEQQERASEAKASPDLDKKMLSQLLIRCAHARLWPPGQRGLSPSSEMLRASVPRPNLPLPACCEVVFTPPEM
eukprot:4049233-Pleurochrysis_carterae.AAC.3